jgi:hypothetical protein
VHLLSQICPDSRAVTAPSLKGVIAEPVIINNIERTWSARVHKHRHKNDGDQEQEGEMVDGNRDHILGWTPMGVRFKKGGHCNGVLINVDEEELARFDMREMGYTRKRIELADIYPHGVDAEDVLYDVVKCPECKLVFKKADEVRRGCGDSSVEHEDISVWVYVQSQK